MEVLPNCTCNGTHYTRSGFHCSHRDTITPTSSSSTSPSVQTSTGVEGESQHPATLMYCCLPQLILTLLSGLLTALFALAGAFTGAVTGALAGRASDSGVLRGTALGAIAGAVLSVEVLEASRAYWCSETSGSRSSPSMTDFIEELLQGRLARDQLIPTVLTDYRWQVSLGNIANERTYASYGYDGVTSRGLSAESLKKLSHQVITEETKGHCGGGMCCTICLQDMEVGDTVRSLRRCHHVFHLTCVDKWLVRHGTCPICRQDV